MKADHLQVHVSGHLEDKRGIYQIIFSWRDEAGKRCRKSISTGLVVKGNKKRAETMLAQQRKELEEWINNTPQSIEVGDELYADFLEVWLSTVRAELKPTTYGNHQSTIRRVIGPYFREKEIRLNSLVADDILDFYAFQMQHVKATTVHKYHNVFSRSLQYAVEKGLIDRSPMEKVKRPKAERFVGKFLKESEAKALFEEVKGHKLELGVILGAYYGLRRAEVVGLRWESINFEQNTITIDHSVTVAQVDGRKQIFASDTVKTKSSFRTLPLVPKFRNKLLEVKKEQDANRKLCGRAYNKVEGEYIYVDPLGNRLRPDYLTAEFPKFMTDHGFRRIRFHDLRHSCASLLLVNGVSLKQIQEWLGHSYFAITANTYAHLDYSSKIAAANAMTWINETSLGSNPDDFRADTPKIRADMNLESVNKDDLSEKEKP